MTMTADSIRISLEELIAREASQRAIKVSASDFYNRTYTLQLAEFVRLREKRAWTVDDVLMRFCSVYGWMPRGIQEWNVDAVPALALLLNQDEPDFDALIRTANRCINNSIVGASKFLHFFDPHCYPIFDSVVASRWWPTWDASKALSRYLLYWEGVLTVGDEAAMAAQSWAKNWMGYEVSGIRAIEALAFYTQRALKRGSPPVSVTQLDCDDDIRGRTD